MNMDVFMDRLLEAAKAGGIDAAEVYYESGERFNARAVNDEINSYQVSTSCGLGLRGTVGGKMGYASTQAFDDEAIAQLVEGVLESAALTESDEQDEIYAGDAAYPVLPKEESDLDSVSAESKLDACIAMEKAALAADERIWKVQGALMTGKSTVQLKNSYGLNLKSEGRYAMAYVMPIAKDGDCTATAAEAKSGHSFADLKPEEIAAAAVEQTLSMLHAGSVPAGNYRTILYFDAMRDLLHTFSSVFSAENAQQKMSLFAGKEGEMVASEVVTIMDDPLLPGGFGSQTFDGEGSACYTKAVIEAGRLNTLLHSRKTAKKQGVRSTGNANRASYSSPVHVAPTNLFIQAGEKSLEQLMQDVGDGIMITEVSGLHAGANPISGDFSLLSKGFVIEAGKKGRPIEQVTVAGNFYQLLKQIRTVGSDLRFEEGGSIGAPSVDAGVLAIAGQ